MEEMKNDIPIEEILAQKGIKSYWDWGMFSEEKQLENKELFKHVIDVYGIYGFAIESIWKGTKPSVQAELKEEFLYCLKKVMSQAGGEYDVRNLWSVTNFEVQEEMWEDVIDFIKENTTTKEISYDKLYEDELNGENIKCNYYRIIGYILGEMPKELQLKKKEFILEFCKQAKGFSFINLWPQIKCKEELCNEVYDIMKEKKGLGFLEVFANMPYDFQKEKLEEACEIFGNPMEVWRVLSPELQREEWENYKTRYCEDLENLVLMFAYSPKDIQEEHMEILDDLILNSETNYENIRNIWFGLRESPNLQKEKWQDIWGLIENDKNAVVDLWGLTSIEMQREKIEYIFEKYSNDIEFFSELCKRTRTFPEYFSKMLALCGDDFEKQVAFWGSMDRYAQNQEYFEQMYNVLNGNNDFLAKMWGGTCFSLQKDNKEKLREIMELSKDNPANGTIILNNTLKSLLHEEDIKMLVQSAIGEDQDIEKVMTLYKELKNINPDIYKTINLQMLSPKLLDILSKEQMLRLSVDVVIQEKIAKHVNQPVVLDVIKNIVENSSKWEIELNDIVSKMDNYENLLNDIEQEELNDEDISQLIGCLSGGKNYFNIENIDQIRSFYEIRKSLCIQILEGQDVSDKMSDEFQKYSSEQKKIFAMLELAYGIDIEEAQNIVFEYGTDIDEIVPQDETEENLINFIKAIKIILNSESQDIDEIYQNNKNNIKAWSNINYSTIAELEGEALQLYTRLYNEAYKLQEKELPNAEYKGKQVEVVEIEGDFFVNVRVEGAYSEWEEPEDYNVHLEQVSPKLNGNCTSFAASNLFARAKPNGPTFVYGRSEEYPLELLAPWDIISSEANKTFSPGSVKYDFQNGIQFRIPEKQVDNTRHNHNEAVKKKWYYDERNEKMVKEKPSYVLYVQEDTNQTNEEREKNPQWKIAKKAAAQLGIKIAVINIEKNLQLQEQKIQEMEKVFLGEKENIGNLSDEKMIERLIVEFENNRVTIRFVNKDLKSKFFTDEKRERLYDLIEGKINAAKITNPERAEELFQAYTQVLQSEIDKAYTINGEQIHGGPELKYIENRLTAQNVQELSKKDIQSKKLQAIYKKYDINLSDIGFINKEFEARTKGNQKCRE